jgi:hypothetical protein
VCCEPTLISQFEKQKVLSLSKLTTVHWAAEMFILTAPTIYFALAVCQIKVNTASGSCGALSDLLRGRVAYITRSRLWTVPPGSSVKMTRDYCIHIRFIKAPKQESDHDPSGKVMLASFKYKIPGTSRRRSRRKGKNEIRTFETNTYIAMEKTCCAIAMISTVF